MMFNDAQSSKAGLWTGTQLRQHGRRIIQILGRHGPLAAEYHHVPTHEARLASRSTTSRGTIHVSKRDAVNPEFVGCIKKVPDATDRAVFCQLHWFERR